MTRSASLLSASLVMLQEKEMRLAQFIHDKAILAHIHLLAPSSMLINCIFSLRLKIKLTTLLLLNVSGSHQSLPIPSDLPFVVLELTNPHR